MVYIKRVQLSHFKSFGGTADVPLLTGFTVVTGPNGSGKSNIMDGLMFALGLSSSKGMRADRLPDLVNQSYANRSRQTVEATVAATFCLKDWTAEGELPPDPDEEIDEAKRRIEVRPGLEEWTVARRLRVTPQGTYTSSYSINDEPCTLTQLHEQLRRLRIYPEGYNIVLQGDVTGIISMHARERREIIDEMAGVAQFDRKIRQAMGKLDEVKEREDRCHIVERELEEQLQRLAKDRIKAEKYKRLREELQTKQKWEAVLIWEAGKKKADKLQSDIEGGDRKQEDLNARIKSIGETIAASTLTLEELNQRVKALGEADLLKLQSSLATHQAEQRQFERQLAELKNSDQRLLEQLGASQTQQQEYKRELNQLQQVRLPQQRQTIQELQATRDKAQAGLDESRNAANAIASESQAWVQQQQQLRQRMDAIAQSLDPQKTEQAQLTERSQQLHAQLSEQEGDLAKLDQEIVAQREKVETGLKERDRLAEQIGEAATAVANAEQELKLQQETQTRLLREQRDKQRQLDKLESMTQAIQETQGTQASRIIMQAGISGVHGIVAELGQVEKRYQTALETAIGGRLGFIVVSDDGVAAAGIELLKRQRGGRATFLPMNKIRPGKKANIAAWDSPEGFVDHAVNLVEFDRQYQDIFEYLFSNTVVFDNIASARRSMGRYRIVTLEGDLLEASGAMTGGSRRRQSGGLRFGQAEASESEEVVDLRNRLEEIERILGHSDRNIQKLALRLKERTQTLGETRDQHRTLQLQSEQAQTLLNRLTQQRDQLSKTVERNKAGQVEAASRLQSLSGDLPGKDEELQALRQQLAELEKSPLHNEWQQRQGLVQERETALQQQELALRSAEQALRDLEVQIQRIQERLEQNQAKQQELRQQQTEQINQQGAISKQRDELITLIAKVREELAVIEKKLGSEKEERDRAERLLREQQGQKQQLEWQLQKVQETQQEQRQQLQELSIKLREQEAELPEPLPEIPEEDREEGVEALQHKLRLLAKRIQAMEPVNMLALEEYERTEKRLEELSEKLLTLESERTELMLRIENFTTLRQRAFMEAYEAVNENFKEIFASLSDGEGYLQLDNPESPLDGGLNLIAHPKGKAVRRLASMSGGEKSLTALSFIFALQRYRPSPFYSFDEVDSFLDGANVERLSRIIRAESDQAQFIVVSHRRPMIEAAHRTIGVTQARGAHTQVLGISQEEEVTAKQPAG